MEDLKTVQLAPAQRNRKSLKRAADESLFDALVGIGFNTNIWSFDPWYVRRILQVLTVLFAALGIWSWSHAGGYRWMFTSFGLVLGAVLQYWYARVECGGGRHIFSPDWRDSFVRTRATRTNYVVDITVGYEDEMTVSIPLSSFKFATDNEFDLKWFALELEQGLPMHKFRAKQLLRTLQQQASANGAASTGGPAGAARVGS